MKVNSEIWLAMYLAILQGPQSVYETNAQTLARKADDAMREYQARFHASEGARYESTVAGGREHG